MPKALSFIDWSIENVYINIHDFDVKQPVETIFLMLKPIYTVLPCYALKQSY